MHALYTSCFWPLLHVYQSLGSPRILYAMISFYSTHIYNEKKRKRKGAMETRLDRVVHCTPVLHTRGLACARTYTLTHAHTGSITSLMIYPTESSLLLRCNGERRRFARECWREKKQHRGRHKLALAQWRERQKRRRTEDEREWARDRRKYCQEALKSQKKKTKKREREKETDREVFTTRFDDF